MPSWCSNILTINGSPDAVSKGFWLARSKYVESRRPDVLREMSGPDGSRSPCHEFESIDWPPREFLQQLSSMLPGSLVKCVFSEPFGGVRGFFSYMDGNLWECSVERFVIEQELRPTTAVSSTGLQQLSSDPA